MKTLNLICATVVATAVLSTSIAQAELRLGLDPAPYPPFYEKDASGTFSGFEIEIGDAVCAAMNEQCVWTQIAWDGIIPALLEKKIDAIVGSMSITEERMKVIAFTDKYYNTPAVLVAAKSSDITDDPATLAGKILGVQVSTTHANYADTYFADTVDAIKTYQAFDEQNNDLTAGRVDAVVGDGLGLSDFLASPEGADFETKAELTDDAIFGPGIGIGLRQGDTQLKERMNAAIAEIRANGTYDAIAKSYFDFDIFGVK